MNTPSTDTPIKLMIRHEMAIHSLYMTFAEQLPGMREFWKDLADEETAHAGHIRNLEQQLGQNVVRFNERRFNRAALLSSLDYMVKRASAALAEGITAVRALSLAADIEHSLLEHEYFAVFESDPPEIKIVLDRLHTETEQHLDRVKSMLGNVRDGTSLEQS